VTATAQEPGNTLMLVGNGTGRDGLGGASFASEDLAEDAETEDRPRCRWATPTPKKRLIECNEALVDEDLVLSARDLGAAGSAAPPPNSSRRAGSAPDSTSTASTSASRT